MISSSSSLSSSPNNSLNNSNNKFKEYEGNKLNPIEDENVMSNINVANCQLYIRKVKINNDGVVSFRITITHKTLRWHVWRTFSDFETIQKQLKIDFPTLPIMALVTPLSRTPYKSKQDNNNNIINNSNNNNTSDNNNTNDLIHQQITLTEWIYAVMDVHIICNHIEIRRLLGLPKYSQSNRYGSMYLPPYALAKARQNALSKKKKSDSKIEIERTLSDNSVESNDFNHLNPTISSLTHGVGYLPISNSFGKKKKKHTGVLSGLIGGVSKPSSNKVESEITTMINSAPSVTSTTLSTTATSSSSTSPTPVSSTPQTTIYSNLKGTNWMDCEFTDQTEAERSMYRDLRMDHKFLVRGKNYAQDGKKIQTGPAIFRLVVMDLFEVETGPRHDHVASLGRGKQRVDALNSLPEPPLLFIMNFQIPGDPPVSIMSIFAASPSIATILPTDTEDTACYKKMWASYFNSTFEYETDRLESWGLDDSNGSDGLNPPPAIDQGAKAGWKLPSDITWGSPKEPGVYPITDFKNMRFKLIPTVAEGNWMVRSAVPSAKPALLGQKLQQRYFRGKNYVETDVDVGSSVIASQIVGVLRGYAKNFVCDVGVVIQGECEDELPERMLACIVINKIDIELRKKLYDPDDKNSNQKIGIDSNVNNSNPLDL